MSFQRTNSGLNNQHHFFNVDYVVYVEGGESLSEEDVLENKYNDTSIDKIFWNKILCKYSTKRFKIKPVGSKSTLNKLIVRFNNGNINNNLICTDSEFDEINNTKTVSDKVIYSFGYSWENDVWNSELIKYILDQFSAVENDFDEINQSYNLFTTDIKDYVSYDAALFSTAASFFPRPNGHQKLLNCNSNQYPDIKYDELQKICERENICDIKKQSFKNRFNLSSQKFCYGHLLNDFCKNYIKFFLKAKFKMSNLNDEVIRRFAINNFLNFISSPIENYYSLLVGKL